MSRALACLLQLSTHSQLAALVLELCILKAWRTEGVTRIAGCTIVFNGHSDCVRIELSIAVLVVVRRHPVSTRLHATEHTHRPIVLDAAPGGLHRLLQPSVFVEQGAYHHTRTTLWPRHEFDDIAVSVRG